ncbi:hypothetical protein INT47_010552 [Mucor saturninus]|uniref:Heat shock protein 70 n=1 Tax=Mucor saturninus TaxID=64648 RepID=A0A8H7QWC0_9FUNG|nr:hypothetical protein INT47_010552 [Mucor saturninus]
MAPINKESPINDPKFTYVVGIDFGTTYSGAAYVFTKPGSEIHDISTWPLNSGTKLVKIPTVIRYHKQDSEKYICAIETSENKSKIKEYDPIIYLFKLHLHEDTRDGIPDLPEGKTVTQVIADYLRYLHTHICSEMKRNLGTKVENEEKLKSSIRYCITVPALWSSKAKSVMRQATILAGIIDEHDHVDRLVMVGEPEAAALYAENMRGGVKIASGKTLMIVDAGGGTIDLTTFEKTIEGETKCFKEITEGIGNTYGSSRLDLNFKEYILQKMEHYPALIPIQLEKLVEDFRKRVKIDFGDICEDCFYFDVSYKGQIREDGFSLDENGLAISTKVLEAEVFKPVIQKVIKLVQFQLDRLNGTLLDYIIIVGGFGQSKYLIEKIKEKFASIVGDVIVPDGGEVAVTRGAVYFGLDPYSISHRRMRLTYGISISSPFIEGVDRLDYKRTDSEGKDICINRFDAIVKKGDDVSIQNGYTRTYYTFNSGACHFKIYGFDDDTIPRYVSNTNESSSNEAYKVAEFVLNLPEGKPGKKTEFTMTMFFGHMEIKAEIALPGVDKKETFTVSYDHRAS